MPLLDFTGTFGLRVAGCDVPEVRIAGMGGRWERRVNLATNPSFEATSGTVVVRTNLHQNPGPAIDATYWGSASNYGGMATVKFVNHEALGACVEIVHGALNTTLSGRWNVIIGGPVGQNLFSVTAGTAYTASLDVADEIPQQRRARFAWYGDDGVPISESTTGPTVNSAPTAWTRVSHTATAPEGATRARFFAETVGATPQNGLISERQRVWARHGLIEAAPVLQPYFDGNTRPALALAGDVEHVDGRVVSGPLTGCVIEGGVVVDPDFTPAWTGPVGASTSVLRGQGVADTIGVGAVAISSTRWSKTGARSLRILRTGTGTGNRHAYIHAPLSSGPKYRMRAAVWTCGESGTPDPVNTTAWDYGYDASGYANVSKRALAKVAGEQELSITVHRPNVPTSEGPRRFFVRPPLEIGSSIWVDDLVIEETTDATPTHDEPFHGDTPDTPDALYRWQDVPHGSPSTAYYAWQPV